MDYLSLKNFLISRMKMSHIYQPVMLRLLLKDGHSTDEEIAKEILKFDPTQIEYYQKIVNNMVGKVLRGHNIVTKNKRDYFLNDYGKLNKEQINELISICNEKVTEYINKRGENEIWSHRRKNRNNVSGSIRYEVLKRAGFRCENCGISAAERALEVDHIEPKNWGGEDSINNYQALCYICNTQKKDRDNTDFRVNESKYDYRADNCLFCTIDRNRIVYENNLSYLIFDNFPVSKHHCLIIPKRHFPSFFEIVQSELNAVNDLLTKGRDHVHKIEPSVKGFNIGVNSGEAAGQTIMHCHIHLIPRYEGDVENPRGGVRHIIPGKGFY